MRRRTVAGLAISCALAACAHQGSRSDGSLAWSMHKVEGEGAKLAFGQPNSDNILIMMVCEPGSGAVRVSLIAPPGGRPQIVLRSGGRTSALIGETAPGMTDDLVIIEADARVSEPALHAFADTGRLSVIQSGRTANLPALGHQRREVSAFFSECRTA